MSFRAHNFGAGPAALPMAVLHQAQQELLSFRGSGISVLEMGHRTPPFEELVDKARLQMLRLMGIEKTHEALFLQGGARHQFAMIPLNFGRPNRPVEVIDSSVWTELAFKEASRVGSARMIVSSKDQRYSELPKYKLSELSSDASYVHFCSNNTVEGTQWKKIEKRQNVRSVIDMSSDILSRNFPYENFDLIFAGAQKNLGPSGITAVLVRKDWIDEGSTEIAEVFQYRAQLAANSMYNTPPTFAIYLVQLVLDWIESQGGVEAMELKNKKKASALYECIDRSKSFFCPIAPEDRSMMNVVFRIGDKSQSTPDERVEKNFLDQAEKANFIGLKGHRFVGGLRASLYNAVELESVHKLCQFIEDFEKDTR